MSQEGFFGSSGGGGSGIIQIIDGDIGSITGAIVTIYANNAVNNSGSSVYFANTGTVSTLNVTDVNSNTLIGSLAGNLTIAGNSNTGVGSGALSSLSTGSSNSVLGLYAGSGLSTGNYNVQIGALAGSSQTGTENSTILINSFGIPGVSNALFIGTATGTGNEQLTSAYIQGVYSNTQDPTLNAQVVTINNTTGQLGVTSAANLVEFTADTGAPFATNAVTIYANNAIKNCGSTVSFDATTPNITLNVSDSNGNTLVGAGSGNVAITGAGNSSLGINSLPNISTGSYNSGFGTFSAQAVNAGNFNTALGYSSLDVTNSGSYNIGIGPYSGDNQTGSEDSTITIASYGIANVSNALFIGTGTGTGTQQLNSAYIHGIYSTTQDPSASVQVVTIDNTTSQLGVTSIANNVTFTGDTGSAFTTNAITINTNLAGNNCGSTVLFNASTPNLTLNVSDGSLNTLIGYNSGNAGIGGFENTALGANTLTNLTGGTQNVAIGVAALQSATSDSQNIAIGFGPLELLNNNANGNIAIGQTAFGSLLTGNGNIGIGSNAGSLLTGQDGTIAIGYNALAVSTGDAGNVAIGYNVLSNNDGGINNNAFGYQTLTTNSTGVNNCGFGTQALYSNSIGQHNCAFGHQALYSNDNGYDNVSIGYLSLRALISGGDNVAIGSGALSASTTDDFNVAIGVGALTTLDGASGIVAIGASALSSSVSDSGNTAVGYNCLGGLAGGNNNTALGYQAMQIGGTSLNNVAIGFECLFSASNAQNNISIGDSALYQLVSGQNNIALGTTGGFAYSGTESNNIVLGNTGTIGDNNVLRIGSGTGTGAAQLNAAYISGIQGIAVTGVPVLVSASDQLGVTVSSRKFKDNIEDMKDYSSSILDLRPVTFTMKGGDTQIVPGLIAEEVAEVMPDLVIYDKAGDPLTVKYHELSSMLLNELKKALARIEILEKKIAGS